MLAIHYDHRVQPFPGPRTPPVLSRGIDDIRSVPLPLDYQGPLVLVEDEDDDRPPGGMSAEITAPWLAPHSGELVLYTGGPRLARRLWLIEIERARVASL